MAWWKFESNVEDSANHYHGSMQDGAVYVDGYVGRALSIQAVQYMYVNTPFINLANRPFTMEAWIFLTSINTTEETGIFGQCEKETLDRCLHFDIRGQKLFMGFYSDDLTGPTNLIIQIWTHVAFVYDMATNTKLIYINGRLDNSAPSNSSYQGTSGMMYVGLSGLQSATLPFSGYMDQVSDSIDRWIRWICPLHR